MVGEEMQEDEKKWGEDCREERYDGFRQKKSDTIEAGWTRLPPKSLKQKEKEKRKFE